MGARARARLAEGAGRNRAEKDSRNVTRFFLVANSNVSSERFSALDFAEDMDDLFALMVGEDAGEVFGDSEWVQVTAADGPHVEVGAKQHRLHFNAVITLKHQVGGYSIGKLKKRIKAYLDENWNESRGWHVHVRLLQDAQRENYANKDVRIPANEAALEEIDPDLLAKLTIS